MRGFLKERIGKEVNEELINEIMTEYGKKIGENNDDKETILALKKDIESLKNEIDSYKTTIEENKKSLESMQSLTNENKDLKAEIQMNGSNVKKEFSKFVRSEVMANVNDETDFETALGNYKKENPQYFGEVQIKKVQSSPSMTNGQQPQTTNEKINNILRGALN